MMSSQHLRRVICMFLLRLHATGPISARFVLPIQLLRTQTWVDTPYRWQWPTNLEA